MDKKFLYPDCTIQVCDKLLIEFAQKYAEKYSESFDINNKERFFIYKTLDKYPLKTIKRKMDILYESNFYVFTPQNLYKRWNFLSIYLNYNKIRKIEIIFQNFFPEYFFTENFKLSIEYFLKKLDYKSIKKSMLIAGSRMYTPKDCVKYFCGICWSSIHKNKNITKMEKM